MEIFVLFIGTLLFLHWLFMKPKNFPPGPPCFPIVGSLPLIPFKNFHFYLEDARKNYGPVIGLVIGPIKMIAVTGAEEVREISLRPEFQGRPFLQFAKPGIMFNEGPSWSVQRRFAIRHLRDFGFGKRSVENVVLEEFDDLCKNVLHDNKIIQTSGLFNISIINILWAMMAGKRHHHDDEDFKKLLNLLNRRFRSGNFFGGISNVFPILRKLFPNLHSFREETESDELLRNFFKKSIEEHKRTKTEEPRDFIDAYLNELEKTDRDSSFSEETLINVCRDLFSAGAESVANTLGFCLLYCVLYPKWQEKVYQEIKAYDSNISLPYLDGKKSLPMTEAFLNEVSRCNTIATLSVPRKALQNTKFQGYDIPKGTFITVSLWSVLQDEKHWHDPQKFSPERFLDEFNNFKKHDGWTPFFGLGPRVCPGENQARSITLVFFVSLIRKFKFSIPVGHPQPSTVCLSGFTNAPQPFDVKCEVRN